MALLLAHIKIRNEHLTLVTEFLKPVYNGTFRRLQSKLIRQVGIYIEVYIEGICRLQNRGCYNTQHPITCR